MCIFQIFRRLLFLTLIFSNMNCGSEDQAAEVVTAHGAATPGSVEETASGEGAKVFDRFLAVIDASCTSCHRSSSYGNFEELRTAEAWLSSKYIDLAFPENSLIYTRLQNSGGDMPLGADVLSESAYQSIVDFVFGVEDSDVANQSAGGSALQCETEANHPPPAAIRRLTHREIKTSLKHLGLSKPEEIDLQDVASPISKGHDNFWQDLQTSRLQFEADYYNAEQIASEIIHAADSPLPASCASAELEVDCWNDLAPWLERLLRRPLDTDTEQRIIDLYDSFEQHMSHQESLQATLTTLLQSAEFLYRTELGEEVSDGIRELTSFEIAHAISFFVTGGLPDEELWQAAVDRELQDPIIRQAHVKRLLAQDAAIQHTAGFIQRWLGLDDIQTVEKDTTRYPSFSEDLRQSYSKEVELFLQNFVADADRPISELIDAPYTFVNSQLAGVYDLPDTEGWQKVETIATQRRGILGTGGFTSVYAHPNDSSPIQRGKVIAERLLCIEFPKPPSDIPALPAPGDDEGLTTRQRVEQHVKDPVCAGCHQLMDPLGFALESFDGAGFYREWERQQAVAVDSHYRFQDGSEVEFNGLPELVSHLGQQKQYHQCFDKNLKQHAFGFQSQASSCSPSIGYELNSTAVPTWGELMTQIVASPEFIQRRYPSAN